MNVHSAESNWNCPEYRIENLSLPTSKPGEPLMKFWSMVGTASTAAGKPPSAVLSYTSRQN